MDSVIVFFAHATQADVEAAAAELGLKSGTMTRGETQIFLWPYSAEAQAAELDPSERDALATALGRTPECAFQVASRHGEAAQFALHAVAILMSQFLPAALDDDFGHLIPAEEIIAAAQKNPHQGIYYSREKQ
jgi:hypothetical protein